MPERSVGSKEEDFEPSIEILNHSRRECWASCLFGWLSRRGPVDPAIARGVLPDTPEIAIVTDEKDLNAPISILACNRNIDVRLRRLAERNPGAPRSIGGKLVDMPECPIGPRSEDFEPPIGIDFYTRGMLNIS